MAIDNGYPFNAHTLPTPSDTPYQTPSRATSRHDAFQSDATFANGSYFDENRTESIASINNPRFSQNLDISFIGEIHALKKEVERKDIALEAAQKDVKRQKNAISELEEAIDALAAEVTQLREDAKARAARQRSLERANRSLQDDSNSAVNGIIVERDVAVQREVDLRKALESEKAKKRSLETDLENAYRLQDEDKQKHIVEKRNIERTNHVLESRIKTLVAEINLLQHTHSHQRNDSFQDTRSYSRADSRHSVRSDEIDREGMSSRASRYRAYESRLNGVSLAEELEREDSEDDNIEVMSSPEALPEEKVWPQRSEDSKARKVMGLESNDNEEHSMGIIMDYLTPSVRNSVSRYADAGTQFTPPPSPKPTGKSIESEPTGRNIELAANQSRKRVSIDPKSKSMGCQTDWHSMVSSSTQTESKADVPVIAIHPPSSRPSSSHTSVVLPPRTRNAACQVDTQFNTKSSSMQTEPIKIDRPVRVPSKPRIKHASTRSRSRSIEKRKPVHISRLRSPPPPPVPSEYPNDDGPLTSQSPKGHRRPIRSGSILAGFDESHDLLDLDDSDDGFLNGPPIRKTLSKVQDSWKLVPQSDEAVFDGPDKKSLANTKPKTTSKTFHAASRTSSGPQRSLSPTSVPSQAASQSSAPPFPVPTRSSSRKIPVSASDGAASPTPQSTSFFTARRDRKKILRKVQSAAAVPRSQRPMNSERGPSPNQFILPYLEERPPSVPDLNTGETSIENTSPQTTVVDAIAQTMVGEWMWKYMRKKTSFGVEDKPGDRVGGVRHKRWVWLAPYERAVIWSGKQPTSGPALLGKGGRKLTIQSVLDVKDETPLKGTAFDRSILILTPERALKFTAFSEERHYIWLTALSFLSHSSQEIGELAVPEPIVQPENNYHRPPSQEHVTKRSHVRDSIRIAKARSRPPIPHSVSSPPPDQRENVLVERPSEDAAEPPQIPRVTAYRRRSSTGPRMSLGALASASVSTFSLNPPPPVRAPPPLPPPPPANVKSATTSRSGSGPSTRRNTITRNSQIEALPPVPSAPPLIRNDFFDAVGTVRMEAFITDTLGKENVTGKKTQRDGKKKNQQPKEERRKKDMRYWGAPESSIQKDIQRDDPFRGF